MRSNDGKHLSFRTLGQESSPDAGEKTLGADYTEAAIRERIAGRRSALFAVAVFQGTGAIGQPAHRHSGKDSVRQGAWLRTLAKVHNLKAMARTLIYLQSRAAATISSPKNPLRPPHDSTRARIG